MIFGKVWGESQELFNNGAVSIHLLRIRPGGYCSEHKHTAKENVFFVISGRLQISVWPPGTSEDDQPDITILGKGETTRVPPGAWHKFEALEETEALEYYQVLFAGPDIDRRSHGGIKA